MSKCAMIVGWFAHDILGFCYCWQCFVVKRFISKTTSLRYVSKRECQVQNERGEMECLCQQLDFTLYFTSKTSTLKLQPLVRSLCLINSFYRRYASRMCYISDIFNRSPIYTIHFIYSIHAVIHSVIRRFILGLLLS